MTVRVVIPTVDGREDDLSRCVSAYRATTPEQALQFAVYRNYPTCGEVWTIGADEAANGLGNGVRSPVPDFVHFTADDLEPSPGWYEAAVACVARGRLPSAVVTGADGQLESCGRFRGALRPDHEHPYSCTLVPFCSLQQWARIRPVPPVHYHSDSLFSARAVAVGYEFEILHAYRFMHHWAMAGRDRVNRKAENVVRAEAFADIERIAAEHAAMKGQADPDHV
jgi:hypothetical protein